MIENKNTFASKKPHVCKPLFEVSTFLSMKQFKDLEQNKRM